jgi:hypothetical protein
MGKPIYERIIDGKLRGSNKVFNVSSCWIAGEGSANSTSIVLKQVADHTYEVKNTATNHTGNVSLVLSVTGPGQARINVTPHSGVTPSPQHLKHLDQDTLITFEGHRFFWHEDNTVPDNTYASLPLS